MKVDSMVIVLDTNQGGIFCGRVGKEPRLWLLDVILPPNVLADEMGSDHGERLKIKDVC